MKKLLLLTLILTGRLAFAFSIDEITYDMKIRIGEKQFVDILVLKIEPGTSPFIGSRAVSGSVTVPGVFTAPLTGTYRCHPWSGHCFLNFEIIARENGQEFKVVYRATQPMGDADADLTGSAYLEDGKLLGEFVATRKAGPNASGL